MKLKKVLNLPKIKILSDNKESETESENARYYSSKVGLTISNKSGATKQSLNPIQFKKSYNFNTQRQKLHKTIEKKDKEKDAIISMNKGHKEVLLFLQELNMGEYFENFINNGIISKEKLLYLNNDNLKLINIPYAHRFRILKKLKESKNLENMKKNLNEKGKLSKIKIKQESIYEEIIIPKEEDDKEIDNDEMRRTFTQAIYDFQKTHNSFYNDDNNNKDLNDEKNKEENILVETGEYIENKNSNNIKQLLPLNDTKILCYFCLKVLLTKNCINKYNKLFCCNNCLTLYEKENYIICKTCNKKIKKIESLPSFNNRDIYYCSLNGLEQLEPERKNWIKKNLIDDDNNENGNNNIDILDL